MGSSPLTRGARSRRPFLRRRRGLIPAHAGSTVVVYATTKFSRAHPRSRGEHRVTHFSNGLVKGSSPLTRGAPNQGPCGGWPSRLIPAHAGSTV